MIFDQTAINQSAIDQKSTKLQYQPNGIDQMCIDQIYIGQLTLHRDVCVCFCDYVCLYVCLCVSVCAYDYLCVCVCVCYY